MAASVSFYAVFSLPPLTLLYFTAVGHFFNEQWLKQTLIERISGALGASTAQALEGVLSNYTAPSSSGLSLALSVGALIFGSLNVTGQLEESFDEIWGVDRRELSVPLRLISFLIYPTVIVVVSSVLIGSTVIDSLIIYLSPLSSGDTSQKLLVVRVVNLSAAGAIGLGISTLLYRHLPNAEVPWRAAAGGGVISTIFFGLVNSLVAHFIGGGLGARFGALGSLVVFMFWLYLGTIAFIFGAVFCRVATEHLVTGTATNTTSPTSK